MSATENKKSKARLIIAVVVVLLIAALFIAKVILENKIAQRAREDLALFDQYIKLESAEVKASLFGASIDYRNIVYSFPDAPEFTLKIDRYLSSGIDYSTLLGNPGQITTIDLSIIENLRVEMAPADMSGMTDMPDLTAPDESQEPIAPATPSEAMPPAEQAPALLPLVALEYYEVRDISYNYRDTRQVLLGNKGNRDPMDLLSKLTPFIGQSRTGTDLGRNLKVNGKQFYVADLTIGSFASSGQTELNKEATGFEMGISNMRCTDIKLEGEDPYLGTPFDVTVADASLHGFKYNYKALLQALSEAGHKDPVELLMSLIPGLYDYEFEKFEINKIAVNYSTAQFKLDAIDLGKRTLKEQGPNVLRGMSLANGSMEIFTLAEAGFDKLVLSDRLVNIIKNPMSIMVDEALQQELNEQPYKLLIGAKLENLFFKDLNIRNMLRLGNWRTDLDLGEKANLKSAIASLFISQDALAQVSMLAYSGNNGPDTFLDGLAQKEGGITLDADLAADMDMLTANASSGALTYGISEPTLGKLKFAVDFIMGNPGPYKTYGNPMLRRAELFLADTGWHDFAMKNNLYAKNDGTPDTILDGLDKEIASANLTQRKVLTAMRDFLKAGGTLQIGINPVEPIEFEYFDSAMRDIPSALGITAEHTPPAAPAQ